jgi:hypothetical protein
VELIGNDPELFIVAYRLVALLALGCGKLSGLSVVLFSVSFVTKKAVLICLPGCHNSRVGVRCVNLGCCEFAPSL